MPDSTMKIVIITQEEHFAIPRNIAKILVMDGVKVAQVVVLDAKGSLVNRKAYFARGFGVRQTVRMGAKLVGAKILNLLDGLFMWRLLGHKRSIRAVTRRYGADFEHISDVNDESFLTRLKNISPDLVVSFSAPCVFKPKLLSIPTYGCVNLHCSYLPQYAGLLPSFWVLYNGEEQAGVTVHYMDSKIDNGAILMQARVPVTSGMSMFELIQRTKMAGGDLMCRVIENIKNDQVETRDNPTEEDQYYTWPDVEQMIAFRKRGGRLI